LSAVGGLHHHVGELGLVGVGLEDAAEDGERAPAAPGQQLDELRQPVAGHLLDHLKAERAREDALAHQSTQDAGHVQRRVTERRRQRRLVMV